MTLIYIRHAHDKKTSKSKLDDRLSHEGKKKARHLARKLIKKHGVPNVIYCSPMYRTRQTAKEFLKVVEKHLRDQAGADQAVPKIINDPRLGRLFTTKQQHRYEKHAHTLRSSTENVILDQGKLEFRQRVEDQFNSVVKEADSLVWNVTHSLVLLHVARINKISRSKHVKYLDTLIVEPKKIKV